MPLNSLNPFPLQYLPIKYLPDEDPVHGGPEWPISRSEPLRIWIKGPVSVVNRNDDSFRITVNQWAGQGKTGSLTSRIYLDPQRWAKATKKPIPQQGGMVTVYGILTHISLDMAGKIDLLHVRTQRILKDGPDVGFGTNGGGAPPTTREYSIKFFP